MTNWTITGMDTEYIGNGRTRVIAVCMAQLDGNIECRSVTLEFPKGTHDSVIRNAVLSTVRNQYSIQRIGDV